MRALGIEALENFVAHEADQLGHETFTHGSGFLVRAVSSFPGASLRIYEAALTQLGERGASRLQRCVGLRLRGEVNDHGIAGGTRWNPRTPLPPPGEPPEGQ